MVAVGLLAGFVWRSLHVMSRVSCFPSCWTVAAAVSLTPNYTPTQLHNFSQLLPSLAGGKTLIPGQHCSFPFFSLSFSSVFTMHRIKYMMIVVFLQVPFEIVKSTYIIMLLVLYIYKGGPVSKPLHAAKWDGMEREGRMASGGGGK